MTLQNEVGADSARDTDSESDGQQFQHPDTESFSILILSILILIQNLMGSSFSILILIH